MKEQALRIALIVNAGLAIALGVTWLQQARAGLFWQSDFSMFYTGGRIVLAGDSRNLYDLEVQTAYQAEIVPERAAPGGLLVFNYPPHVALLAAFLAVMARDTAFYAWMVIQLAIAAFAVSKRPRVAADLPPSPLPGEAESVSDVAGTHFLPATGSRRDPLAGAAILVAILAFPGLFVDLQMGQVSLVVTVALLGLIEAVESDRSWRAGAWLVVASIKPQLALPAVVALLFGCRAAVIGRGALLFAPVALLTLFLVGPWCWLQWIEIVRLTAGQVGDYGVHPDAMFNLRGRLFAMLGVDQLALVNTISTALLVGVLGLIACMAWFAVREDARGFRLRMALSLQLGLLATPHLNPTDTLVFVIPGLLLWSAAPCWRTLLAAVLLSCPLLLAVDLYAPVGGRPFVWVMVVLAGVMGWLYRVHRLTASATPLRETT